MKKSISILGSTGSIGSSTFQIINKKRKFFKINLLSANKIITLFVIKLKIQTKIFVITDQKYLIRQEKI